MMMDGSEQGALRCLCVCVSTWPCMLGAMGRRVDVDGTCGCDGWERWVTSA